ncbi:MAG: response regulator transcription factor [Oscillospiraceae bacterium]|nr:response regulator transcription factor [Oscillospiraceae bacterium]
MHHIFLIEDDRALAETLAQMLTDRDFKVTRVRDFRRIAEEFEAAQPQLVLLDLMLPFDNGYHWCAELRKRSDVPIVFLSSAADNLNIVTAMQMGGDDFIAKPVDINVLTAKLQAILRRSCGTAAPALSLHGLTLHPNDASADYQGSRIELTRNEFRILQTLMEQHGKIVSRDTLMMKLWQDDCYVEENTLTVNVTRLRKKLAAAGLSDFIRTKVGSGYLIGD